MADTKTTGLTANTTPVSTDIMYMVDDPGGSPLSQKMTLATLRAFVKATGGRELLSEQTPTGTGTVTFGSIPATYKSLEIEIIARSTQAATNVDLNLQFNGDTTAGNYQYAYVNAYATGTTGGNGGASFAIIQTVSAGNSPAGSCGSIFIRIHNYAGTTFRKEALFTFTNRRDDVTVFQMSGSGGMEWENTAAINQVVVSLSAGNYDTGSTLRLYGVY